MASMPATVVIIGESLFLRYVNLVLRRDQITRLARARDVKQSVREDETETWGSCLNVEFLQDYLVCNGWDWDWDWIDSSPQDPSWIELNARSTSTCELEGEKRRGRADSFRAKSVGKSVETNVHHTSAPF